MKHRIAAGAFVERTKVFCFRKTRCSFLERQEVLIMLFMIRGVLKISPFVTWVRNNTDLAGCFRQRKLIVNCCK